MEVTSIDTILEKYLNDVENLTRGHETNPDHLNKALEIIQEQFDTTDDSSEFGIFLLGEQSFYSGQYEQALKYYLQAKSIPCFEFYCFRASAFAAKHIDNSEKAHHYADRAIKIRSDDPMILSLIHALNQEDPISMENEFAENEHVAAPEEKTFLSVEKHTVILDKLQERMTAHQSAHEAVIAHYLDLAKKPRSLQDNAFFMVNGWDVQNPIISKLMPQNGQGKAAYGCYLRWNGKGYAINPGEGFLEKFHEEGYHIHDIDVVISTSYEPETYADVKKIHQLNSQLNHICAELHLIHYYLNPAAHQDLSKCLKPHFKQERNAIHCMELFLDSPEIEKIEISADFTLLYFPTDQKTSSYEFAERSVYSASSPSLGIVMELRSEDSKHECRIGYISDSCWTPLLAHHLGYCDLLIAGFGETNNQDYEKISFTEGCLGYHGTMTLMNEMSPQLLLCTEFSGLEGDIRLEAVRKMRAEKGQIKTTILPSDKGLCIDLMTMKIKCSITKCWLDPSAIRVIRTSEAFGTLCYLSADNCL